MTNGRAIGANFERTICNLLKDELNIEFRRDLEQYRTKDHGDLITDSPFPFVIECKRRATGKTYSYDWWEQVLKSSALMKKKPVLIYQLMRSPIKVVMDINDIIRTFNGSPIEQEHLVEMSLPSFCMIVREMLND